MFLCNGYLTSSSFLLCKMPHHPITHGMELMALIARAVYSHRQGEYMRSSSICTFRKPRYQQIVMCFSFRMKPSRWAHTPVHWLSEVRMVDCPPARLTGYLRASWRIILRLRQLVLLRMIAGRLCEPATTTIFNHKSWVFRPKHTGFPC